MDHGALILRPAKPGDGRAIARLAALDAASPPAGEKLVAELEGVIVAALGLRADDVVAYSPAGEIVRALRHRRSELISARRFSHAGSAARTRGARRTISLRLAAVPA